MTSAAVCAAAAHSADCCSQIDVNVEREVLNHKTLVHPNIVQFREVRSSYTAVRLCQADLSLNGLYRPLCRPAATQSRH